MNESQKQELLELIDMHSIFHGMYKEEIYKSNPNEDRWNLYKQIRDEKLEQIKSFIGEIK